MTDILKSIINKTIEREYQNTMSNYATHLEKEEQWNKKDMELTEKFDKSVKALYEVLPQEYHYLVDDLQESALAAGGIESMIAFKQGLILGVTELNYLGEVGPEIQCL